MKLEIMDKLAITDTSTFNGVVMLEENGKIIFCKKNIITDAGRKWIITKVFGVTSETIDKVIFGEGGQTLPSPTDETLDDTDGISYDIGDGEGEIDPTLELDGVYVEYKIENLTVDTGTKVIRELGLMLSGVSSPEEIEPRLFSRVVFDPVVLGNGSKYTLTYRVYF